MKCVSLHKHSHSNHHKASELQEVILNPLEESLHALGGWGQILQVRSEDKQREGNSAYAKTV